MKKILIFSAGSAGREIFQLINSINQHKKEWKVVGYVDDNLSKKLQKIDDVKIFSNNNKPCRKEIYAVTGLMDPTLRGKIYSKEIIKNGYGIPNLIHPSVELPKCFKFGKGNIIFSNVHISFEVSIQDFSIISNFCDVGHNLISKDLLTLMPSAIVGGNCNIGYSALLGSGVKILQNIKIGDNCKIGIGCTVTSNIASGTSVIEYQRKAIKKND